ncbi:MAG TPA: DUF420 domain-containing protein [Polyangiaceae bacterium]|nr:DUF420 domain-containing protein [Polyangiaceae bacterium]
MEATETPTARRVIAGLTAFVFAAVGVVLYAIPHSAAGGSGRPDGLATLNAALNGGASICLVLGWVFIKRKRVALHRAAMLTAFVLSSVFLLTYLAHHARVGHVEFHGEGAIRTLYFALLVPHILLAAVIVPLALATIRRGWVGAIQAHRSLARKTLPLWLYVSVTGVLLYFMLYR